jgi:microsomal dipeptidase-like Zn-dependent dipeptidase
VRLIKRTLSILAVILVIAAGIFFFIVPGEVEKRMNTVLRQPPYPASERAVELHRKLLVADMHADTLLWDRDLLSRSTRGHVDIPRLLEGGVALQAFTVVTKTPRNMNIESNTGDSDNIRLLAIAERWPFASWRSLKERALYQARKLHDTAARSKDKFVIIKSAGDLNSYLDRRKHELGLTAGFLGIEGAHALDGDVANVDVLFDAGFRMIAPVHFFDNDIAGSAHGVDKGGLTEAGSEMIRRMEEKRMIVDLAHASPQTIDDVLEIARRPVVVSHSGVKGTCDNARNLSDDQLKGIARTGGIVAIGFWDTATCGTDAQAIARAIRYTVNLIGVEHVGLGSDYDGAVAAPFDTTGVVLITEALQGEGFTDKEVELIMGGNIIRLLLENLP